MDYKRLTIMVPEYMHKQLKMITAARDCSMRDYIIQHIQQNIERDMKAIQGNNDADNSDSVASGTT